MIGLCGNIISFAVYSRKIFRKNSAGVYCRLLAIFHSAILIMLINDSSWLLFNFDIFSSIDIICKFSSYVYTAAPAISSWILAMFAIDKTISIVFNNKFEFIRKSRFQTLMISSIIFVNCIIYIMVPIDLAISSIQLNNNQTDFYCELSNLSYSKTLTFVLMIESALIPFTIMIFTTIIISTSLISSRKKVIVCNQCRELLVRQTRDRKFAITSAIINILYLVFQSSATPTFLIEFILFIHV